MPISITIADSANGTGAIATIAGSDAGQTVTVYTQRTDDNAYGSASSWTNSGSRTGNGTVSLSLTPAYYWAYASGTAGAVASLSLPVRFLVSRASQAVYDKILDAVVAGAQDLDLSGLRTPPGKIPAKQIKRFLALNAIIVKNQVKPFLAVVPPDSITQPGTSTNQDDWGYPVLLAAFDASPPEASDRAGTYLKWRQQFQRKFISQRLDPTGIKEQFFALYDPKITFQWPDDAYDHLLMSFGMRFVTREPRGV